MATTRLMVTATRRLKLSSTHFQQHHPTVGRDHPCTPSPTLTTSLHSQFSPRERSQKRKFVQVWWDKGEADGAARKLLCAGLFLRDSNCNHEHGDEKQEMAIMRKDDDTPINNGGVSAPANASSNDQDKITAATEVYIDNMVLDCEEALQKWAAYYGVDLLHGTRMNAEQLARLEDFSSDDSL